MTVTTGEMNPIVSVRLVSPEMGTVVNLLVCMSHGHCIMFFIAICTWIFTHSCDVP